MAIFMGYSIGSAPIVSYHYGAGNHTELKNLFRKSLTFLMISGVVLLAASEVLASQGVCFSSWHLPNPPLCTICSACSPCVFHDLVHAKSGASPLHRIRQIKTCPCPPNPRWTTGVCWSGGEGAHSGLSHLGRYHSFSDGSSWRSDPWRNYGELLLSGWTAGGQRQNCRLSETTPPLSAVHRSQAERVR